MKKFLWCTILFLLIVPAFASAQVSSSGLSNATGFGKSVYGLGFSAGWTSGVGISFREHLPTKTSLQAVFGIIKTSKLLMSLGGELQYDLVRNPKSRFFGVTGLSYQYSGSDGNELSGPFHLGVGIGGEFLVQDSFSASVEGLFTYFSDGRVIPLPQVAVHYYFN
jgi:hypothetical protein